MTMTEYRMTFNAGRLDHYNVSTALLEETIRFYVEVLGFENGPRPPFDFPGAWLYSEGRPVLHLNDVSGGTRTPAAGTGVIEHVAFRSRGFDALRRRLVRMGLEHSVYQVPGRPLRQIFVHDPNGVEIELNFTVPESDDTTADGG